MAVSERAKRNAEKNRSYWAAREAEQLKHNITDEREYDKELQRIYKSMLDSIQSQIDGFYGRYASKEGITLAEAKKRVAQLDIEAYERKAERYVKEKNFSPKANEQMRIYNLTMKVNRLEMLKANIGLEMIAGHDELEKFMSEILQGRTMDELERQAGILGKTVRSNAEKAKAIVNGSFHNATFSDRIWQYQDLMRIELDRLLQTGLIQGKNPRAIAKDLQKYWYGNDPKTGGGAVYCMERLMRTELARVQTEAQKQSFARNGFEHYMFIANGGCCDICRELNGKHFPVAKMMPGENAPPMHPHCRCSTAAWEDDAEYNEWLDYLSNGGTTEDWNGLKNKTKVGKIETGKIDLGSLEADFGKKHSAAIRGYLENAPETARRLWNTHAGRLRCIDAKYRGKVAHYDPNEDGVRLSITRVSKATEFSAAYQTVFHEFGHQLDYVLNRVMGDGEKYKAFSKTYKNGVFGKTLKKEANAAIDAFAKAHAVTDRATAEKMFSEQIKAELSLMQRGDISDMFEAAMTMSYPFGVGHGHSYWRKIDNGTEGFAEMYSAMINNPESWEQIQRFFPESCKIFLEMLDEGCKT